jgi:uncharacterized protein
LVNEIQTTTGQERLWFLDALRGFALVGILLINSLAFASPGTFPFLSAGEPWPERLVLVVLLVFVESKFFTVFSLLFGTGFALQFLKAERNGKTVVPFFRRRLFFLGIFGIAHIILLWEGDILLLYALVGLLMIPFRNMAPGRLLRWASGLLLVPTLFFSLALAGIVVARAFPESGQALRDVDAEIVQVFAESRIEATNIYGGDRYQVIMGQRLQGFAVTGFLLLTRVPTVLAMFLLGLYAGKIGLVNNLSAFQPLLQRLRLWGLTLGLGSAVVIGLGSLVLPPTLIFVVAFFNQTLAGPLTALGYAAAVALATQQPGRERGFQPLIAYGRMALTNYLLQSVIFTTLFYGYGFGLVGSVSRVGVLALAIVVNLILIGLSLLWLRMFQYGPMEWLWRSLNYGRLQRIRTQPGSEASLASG